MPASPDQSTLQFLELQETLATEPDRGVESWCDLFAEALVTSNVERSERLVADTVPLPPPLADLVQKRFRPAVEALRSGGATEALKKASADFGETGKVVCALAAADGLKGLWLEALAQKKAAAASYVAAARHAGENEPERAAALHLLTRACELDPAQPLAHWYLADAWRIKSATLEPPFVDRLALEQSLAAWERGFAVHPPDTSSSWAYLVRAWISEMTARAEPSRQVACCWDAVLFLERSLILDEADAARWTSLGRCHRALGNEETALHATAKAVALDPDDGSALEERAAILADTGAFADAKAAIDKRLALDAGSATPWIKGVQAYFLAHQAQSKDGEAARADYRAALILIDDAIAADQTNVWNLDLKATCCAMLGDGQAARDVYGEILRVAGAPERLAKDDARIWAFAAYRLGKLDDAVTVLERLSAEGSPSGDISRALGLCWLAKGEAEKGEHLILRQATEAGPQALTDFVQWELPDLEPTATDLRPEIAEARERIATMFSRLAAQSAGTRTGGQAAAAAELEKCRRGDKAGTVLNASAEAAARAGEGRLLLETGRWRDAASMYAALRAEPGLFPEATLGLNRVFDAIRAKTADQSGDAAAALAGLREGLDIALQFGSEGQVEAAHVALGQALWRQRRDRDALEQFVACLTPAVASTSVTQAAAHARVGVVQALLGDAVAARQSFDLAVRNGAGLGRDGAGRALGDFCRPLLRGIADFWRIDAAWDTWATDERLDAIVRRAFAHARQELAGYLDEVCQLAAPLDPSSSGPFVTPIALEVGSAIVPLVDPQSDKSQNGKFINLDIAAMRTHLQDETGLRNVPGVRVRSQPATTDGYAILLDEVAIAAGTVSVGSKFLVEPAERPSDGSFGAVAATDPATGLPGRWYPVAEAKSETDFILAHVEAVLRKHAEGLLGSDDVQALLNEQKKAGVHTAFVSHVLDDRRAFAVLTVALRSLLREGVPITDMRAIVGALEQDGLANADEAVRKMRYAVKAQLPGNNPETTLLQIPDDWETSGDTGSGFDVSSLTAHHRLVSIRRWLEARSQPLALVTRAPSLRPLVRRLIAAEFPSVAVLSHDEVLHPERIIVAADHEQ